MQKKLLTMCLLMLATSIYLSNHFTNTYSGSKGKARPLLNTRLDVGKLDKGTYEIDVNSEDDIKFVRVVVN